MRVGMEATGYSRWFERLPSFEFSSYVGHLGTGHGVK